MAGFGFKPVRHLSGSPYNGACKEYIHLASDSAAIFVGSLVKFTGAFGASGAETGKRRLPVVAVAGAGDASCGVCVGVIPVNQDSPRHCAASTLRTILVADDPKLIFEVQEDAVGGALAETSVGYNTDITAESGNTTTGQSTQELDSSDVATAAGQVKIMRMVQTPNNVTLATSAPLTRWEVMIAEHQWMEDAAQIGADI